MSVLSVPRIVSACSIPVFRYALERWAANPYQLLIFHKKEIPEKDREAVRKFEMESFANLAGWYIDMNEEIEENILKIWNSLKDKDELPRVALCYPGETWEAMKRPVLWSGPFNPLIMNKLANSPARKKIADEILAGKSAVWVMIESGNSKEDDKSARILKERLDLIEKMVELPEAAREETSAGVMAGAIPLKIDFSLIRISRDDPEEQLFIDMLLGMEPDSGKHKDKPIAFPVFGQGRSLWALIGEGINVDNIDEVCSFLLGGCSCTVKGMNPGFDILMSADWYRSVTNIMSVPDEAPELVGMAPAPPATETNTAANAAEESLASDQPGEPSLTGEEKTTGQPSTLYRNLFAVLVVILIVTVPAYFLISRRGNE